VNLEDPAARDRETKIAGLVKGVTACNREACQCRLIIGQRWWNLSTQQWYCRGCANRINNHNHERICVRESEKP
jgi:hypothetical protein